jgi:hypothetical protein
MGYSWRDEIRPCVKDAYDNGSITREDRRKMVYAIIYELNRLGVQADVIKAELVQWNDRCRNKLSPGDAKRQLCDYVDWFNKHECRLSCKSLRDYCIDKSGSCPFSVVPKTQKELTYTISQADNFLIREFPESGKGHTMSIVLQSLVSIWNEKGRPRQLFAGTRSVQARILETHRSLLDLMTILRRLRDLSDIGFLSMQSGERGSFGFRRSNAYQLLDWTPPSTGDNA